MRRSIPFDVSVLSCCIPVLRLGILGVVFSGASHLLVQAQSPAAGPAFHALSSPLAATTDDPWRGAPDFFPQMLKLEAPSPDGDGVRDMLMRVKAERAAEYRPDGADRFARRADLPGPSLGAGFQGNSYNFSIPNDNNVAISNAGWVISVINSTIWVLDTLGNDTLRSGLGAFADTLGITAGKFDPKVQYDPIEDRFVLAFLAGFDPSDTHIILAFSTSNNPLDPWNFYSLPGNPRGDNTWSDYPMIALTEDELFLTINLLREGEPWQTGFEETLIWQVDKQAGYAGLPIGGGYWDGIQTDGRPIRNLRPIQGGSTLYGPDLWLVSNRNFALSNDSIFLVHVTDRWDEPGVALNVQVLNADQPYGVPPVARQPSENTFDTNDGRILGAFIEGDKIQFVSATIDPATGLTGIYHGLIEDVSTAPLLRAKIIGDRSADSLDYGYPNIAFTGTDPSEIQSIIVFDASGPNTFPQFAAIYHNYLGYSEPVVIKEGETFVDIASGPYERWGDYTGIQRVYDQPGVVWASGNFGKVRPNLPPFGIDCDCNATWVGQLKATESVSVGSLPSPEGENRPERAQIWPNPASNTFDITFNTMGATGVVVRILAVGGSESHVLWSGRLNSGEHRFRFDASPLSPGHYVLDVRGAQGPIATTPIVVQR
jgi:hypothetical protein